MGNIVVDFKKRVENDMAGVRMLLNLNLRTLPRGYYQELKDLVLNSRQRAPQRICDLIIYLVLAFRLANHLVMFYGNFTYELWRFDYLAAFGYHYPNDYNLVLCFIFFIIVIFGSIAQGIMYFTSTELLAWKLYHDIIVRNTDIYLDCIREQDDVANRRKIREQRLSRKFEQFGIPRKAVQPFSSCWAKLAVWFYMEHIDTNMLMKNRLKYVPNLSVYSRTWLLVGLDFLEIIYIYLPFSFRCFALLYFAGYLHMFAEPFPPWYWTLILVDFCLFNYITMIFVRIAHVGSFCVLMGSFIYALYLKQLYVIPRRLLLRYSTGKYPLSIVISKDIDQLMYFLVEHTRVCYYLMQSNRDLWGRFLLVFVPIDLLTILFLSFYVLEEDVPPLKVPMYLSVLYFYIFVIFVIFLPLAYISYLIHRCSGSVNRLQASIHKSRIDCKLKFMTLHERVATVGHEYGLTIGPIRTITFPIIGTLCIQYIVNLLFIINFHRSADPFASWVVTE